MLEHVHAGLAAADWVRALGLALDVWRDTRAPTVAELVVAGSTCSRSAIPAY